MDIIRLGMGEHKAIADCSTVDETLQAWARQCGLYMSGKLTNTRMYIAVGDECKRKLVEEFGWDADRALKAVDEIEEKLNLPAEAFGDREWRA